MSTLNPWTRLEARSHETSLRRGLDHEVRDPAWLLGRQLQVGEFDGFDGGTPILVEPRGRVARIDGIREPGADSWQDYDPGVVPLDPVLEGLGPPGPRHLMDSVEAGRELERRVGELAGRQAARLQAAVREQIPLGTDRWEPGAGDTALLRDELRQALENPAVRRVAERLVAQSRQAQALLRAIVTGDDTRVDELTADEEGARVLADLHHRLARRQDSLDTADPPRGQRRALDGAVVDGAALAALLRSHGPERTLSRLAADLDVRERAVVGRALAAWQQWLDEVHPAPEGPGTWSEDELAYALELRTEDGDELAVHEHRGGRLDWPDLEVTDLTEAGDEPLPDNRQLEPSPVRFAGLRPERWWELVDERMNLAALRSDPEDLAAMLVREFVLRGTDGWLRAVLPLPMGSLCALTSCEVTDTFGDQLTLHPRPGWSLFQATAEVQDDTSVLVVPPTAPDPFAAEAHDRVHLLLDHASHRAWAGEEIVADHLGRGVHRRDLRADDAPSGEADTDLTYRLRTPVPAAWFPLVEPDETSPDAEVLALRQLTDQGDAGRPLGEFLHDNFVLARDRIPDDGRVVDTRWRSARWSDGSWHIWRARRVRDGSDETPPGLAFDRVDPL